MKRRVAWGMVAALYSVCALLSLWAIVASARGWAGVAPDPLSALPAMVLALPWSLALGLLPDDAGPVLSGLFVAAGLAANAAGLWWLALRTRRRSKGP